jgi:hypothetical protein
MDAPIRSLLLSLALLTTACPGPGAGSPLVAVDAYAAALRGGDYGRAYDLMSAAYRAEHTREDFVRMMKDNPGDARETASRLSASSRRVEVSARYVYGDLGDELRLVREGGHWRIASNPVDFYPQDTPANALRSFVRAVELKRWDVVMRFVPNEFRPDMTEAKLRDAFTGEDRDEAERQQTDLMMRVLTANLGNPIEQDGEEARMTYGDRFEVVLVREDGVWKIKKPG